MGVSDRCSMTWEKSKLRWRKMYRGKVYVISCEQLKVPATKEDSYRAANAWWQRKLAELQAEAVPARHPGRHPHDYIIRDLERRRDEFRWRGAEPEADELDERATLVWAMDEEPREEVERMLAECDAVKIVWPNEQTPDRIEITRRAGIVIPDGTDPAVLDYLFGDMRIRLHEETRRPSLPSVPAEKTLRGLSARFLENTNARMLAGNLSASEYDTAQRCVGHAVEFFGPGDEPSVITAERWEAYWRHLLAQVAAGKQSREYVKKDWRYGKAFVRWMATMGKMVIPANLEERRYRFGDTHGVIEIFTLDEVRRLVDAAPGQTKLHLLLMLNIGVYQSDISDLRREEVDLVNGIITRQRSKTRHHGAKIPTVSYRLWPITHRLLTQFVAESKHPELALTTEAGKPWVEPLMKGEKFTRRDGIKSNFAHIQRRLKIDKPLKVFRKTSSSMLDNHPEFGRYAQFFLGQSGRSIAEKHYVKPSQVQFDRAVEWLGIQYKFLPAKEER